MNSTTSNLKSLHLNYYQDHRKENVISLNAKCDLDETIDCSPYETEIRKLFGEKWDIKVSCEYITYSNRKYLSVRLSTKDQTEFDKKLRYIGIQINPIPTEQTTLQLHYTIQGRKAYKMVLKGKCKDEITNEMYEKALQEKFGNDWTIKASRSSNELIVNLTTDGNSDAGKHRLTLQLPKTDCL